MCDSTGIVKTGYVNGKGELVMDPATEESNSYGSEGDRTVFTAHRGNSLIYGDVDGIRTIDASTFSNIDTFRDGYATATLKVSGKKVAIDRNGKILFEDNGGKWGFIDKTGEEVISPIYDQVDSSFHNGLAAASLSGKWGLIDKAGNAVIPFEYDNHIYAEEGSYFIAGRDGKTYPLDASGKPASDEYSYMRQEADGRIYVSKNVNGSDVSAYYPPGVVPPHDYSQKIAILDSAGNNLTSFKYSNAKWSGGFWNDFQVVTKYYYGGAGLVNRYGAEVLPTVFEDIILTKEGYAFVTVADPDTGGNGRVGYFKIPEHFNEAKGSRPVTAYLDGVELYFDSEPVIKNQRTMVPMRKILESLGAEVEWDDGTKTVTAKSDDQTIKLTIGNNIASDGGDRK
ncbi:MAG: WG repeat-containing protein [Syntrophorhabdus sp.]